MSWTFCNSGSFFQVRVPRPIDIGGISPRRPNNPHLPIQLPATTTTAKAIFRPGTSTTTVFPPNSGDRTNHAASTTTERMQVLVNFTQYCPPATARGLFWNWTKSVRTLTCHPSASNGVNSGVTSICRVTQQFCNVPRAVPVSPSGTAATNPSGRHSHQAWQNAGASGWWIWRPG